MVEKLRKSSEYFVFICGFFLFISVLLISAEIILRKFFLISFGGSDEISGYILGIIISWSLAFVLFEKMHIRIDILYNKVGQNVQHFLDVIAMAFTLAFVGILVYYGGEVFYTSFVKSSTANTPLGTKLWIPQALWVLGYCYFLVVVALLFFKSIQTLITKTKNSFTDIEKV